MYDIIRLRNVDYLCVFVGPETRKSCDARGGPIDLHDFVLVIRRLNIVILNAFVTVHGEILPWFVSHTVRRPLQDPVAGSGRNGEMDDDIGHLINLEQHEYRMYVAKSF